MSKALSARILKCKAWFSVYKVKRQRFEQTIVDLDVVDCGCTAASCQPCFGSVCTCQECLEEHEALISVGNPSKVIRWENYE